MPDLTRMPDEIETCEETPVQLPQLKRIRWAVRAALFLGVAASVAANVLHALPNPISQAISAWPPLALLLTVELTSRIPMHRRALAALRVLATVAIAGIAAWVSYWHMQGVAVRYGETPMSSFLLPISVDGLIVVASVSLVELAGRIRVVEEERLRAANAPAVAPVQFVQPAPAPVFQAPQPAPSSLASRTGEVEFDRSALSDEAIREAPVSPAPPVRPYPAPLTTGARPAPLYANGSQPPARPTVRPAASTTTRVTSSTIKPAESRAPKQRRERKEAVQLADELEAMDPHATEKEIADQLGMTPASLRRARREVASSHVS
jgi:Protein of unknown function (DUF2637)